TTLQQAVEESINVVTVKLQERIGVDRTIRVARRVGISSPLNADLTLALGTSDLSLLELTSAYSALANQGVWVEPTAIRYVTDAQGKLLFEGVPQGTEAMAPAVAYVITHMLEGVVERGTGQGANVLGRARRDVRGPRSAARAVAPGAGGRRPGRGHAPAPADSLARSLRPRRPRRHALPRVALEESPQHGFERVDRHADLLHRITVADRDLLVARLRLGGVADGLDIDGDPVGGADLVLPAVEPADRCR